MLKLLPSALVAVVILSGPAVAGKRTIGEVGLGKSHLQVPLLGEVKKTDIPESMFYEQVDDIVLEEKLLTAGYISKSDQPYGRIIDTNHKGKELFDGDIAYINRGSSDKLKKGDTFFVYRRMKEIMATNDKKKKIGNLISIRGKLKVIDVGNATSAKCIVTKAYGPIFTDDFIIPQFSITIPTMDEDRPLEDKSITGTILAINATNREGMVGDVVYLDVGRDAGVDEGDIFGLYDIPAKKSAADRLGYRKQVGKARVITVRGATATAIITYCVEEILVGQNVAYIQER